MSRTYTGLELAKEKASKEYCILFYQQYETVDNLPKSIEWRK